MVNLHAIYTSACKFELYYHRSYFFMCCLSFFSSFIVTLHVFCTPGRKFTLKLLFVLLHGISPSLFTYVVGDGSILFRKGKVRFSVCLFVSL